MRSVLVYSWGEILGDGVWKLPCAAALRGAFPGARITWAAPYGSVYLGALKRVAAPLFDEILTGPGMGREWTDLFGWQVFGGRRFDVVIDAQMILASTLTARRAARHRFVSATGGFLLSSARPRGVWPQSVAQQFLKLIALAAGRDVQPGTLDLVTPEAVAAAEALLPAGPRYVGFAPGAGVPNKRWPLDRVIAVARLMADSGLVPVFFIGPAEREYLEPVRSALPEALFPEEAPSPVRGPDLCFALAPRLHAALANDSGIGHVLGLGGAPLVTLYKSTRMAAKFPTWSPRPVPIAADTFGAAGDIGAIPVRPVADALAALAMAR